MTKIAIYVCKLIVDNQKTINLAKRQNFTTSNTKIRSRNFDSEDRNYKAGKEKQKQNGWYVDSRNDKKEPVR